MGIYAREQKRNLFPRVVYLEEGKPNPYQADDVKWADGCTTGAGGRPQNMW